MPLIEFALTIISTLTFAWLCTRLPHSDHPVSIAINGLSGFFWQSAHSGKPTPAAEITQALRYPGTTPPAHSANLHGEVEYLEGDIPVVHWYEEVLGSVYHFVTAGDPNDDAVLIVPGLPESWWAFHHQIAELSADHFVIAIDMKGFGQSDKRLNLDYTNPTMAREVAALLDRLGVHTFSMMGHDRGAVLTDHLTHEPSLQGRILRYVRMQQSFNEPHGEPEPPHHLLKTRFGEALFGCRNFVSIIYRAWFPSNLSESTLQRLEYEFTFRGTAAAIRKYFETTNFASELKDRHDFLFASMTMPLLILQGRYDKGQHPEEYADSPQFVTDARVQFIHANHFFHLENPTATNRAIRKFFATTDADEQANTSHARAAY